MCSVGFGVGIVEIRHLVAVSFLVALVADATAIQILVRCRFPTAHITTHHLLRALLHDQMPRMSGVRATLAMCRCISAICSLVHVRAAGCGIWTTRPRQCSVICANVFCATAPQTSKTPLR